MPHFTTVKAVCKDCRETLGAWGYSGSTPISKRDVEYFESHLPTVHKGRCGGPVEIHHEQYEMEGREKPAEIVPKQKREKGGGRKAILKPCPSCQQPLSKRQRRMTKCIHCGEAL